MPSLIGFRFTARKAKKGGGGSGSGGFSDTEALTLLRKKYLGTTATGEFSSPYEVNTYLDMLNKVPETDKIAIEKAEMGVILQKFKGREKEVMLNKTIFEEDTQRLLNQYVTTDENGSIAGMPSIIANYSEIYALKAQEYANNVMADAYSKYGTNEKIPEDVLKYAKELEENSTFYRDVYNSYVPGPDGQVGRLQRDNIAFVPKLNQATGEMIGFEMKPQSKVDMKNYMRADTPVSLFDGGGTIPTYLPVTTKIDENGNSYKSAIFGNIEYKQNAQTGENGGVKYGDVLVAQQKNNAWYQRESEQEKNMNDFIDDAKVNGLKLNSNGGFKFNAKAVSPDSVSTTRGHLFYTNANGQSQEIDGADAEEKFSNLETYLRGIGKNPDDLIGRDRNAATGGTKVRLASPDIFSQVAPTKISSKTFAPPSPDDYGPFLPGKPLPTPGVQAVAPQAPQPETSFFAGNRPSAQPTGGISLSGASRINVPNKPDAGKESVAGKSWVADVVAKGAKFFSGMGE